jgi:hypothetical protein
MEVIKSIEEHRQTDTYTNGSPMFYGGMEGYKITTDDQEITLLMSIEQDCCEDPGFFLSEDDFQKFIGAQLFGIELTDTNRSNTVFTYSWSRELDDREYISLDAGDVMFVDIKTSVGTLQFVAYNSHNGYYGHSATVTSKQLTHETTL